MLRFDSRSAKLGGFVARKEDYSARLFSVAFEHLLYRLKAAYDYHAGRRLIHPATAGIITHERKVKKYCLFFLLKSLTAVVFQSWGLSYRRYAHPSGSKLDHKGEPWSHYASPLPRERAAY